jgi:hypothetical protein
MQKEKQMPVRPHLSQDRLLQQRIPRYGGGGGGGGERRGPRDYEPKDVSDIFQLLQQISENYFFKDSHQPISEGAIRDLHVAVFEKLARGAEDKAELLAFLRHLATHADQERLERGQQLDVEEADTALRRTVEKIRGKIFPKLPE